MNVSVKSLHKPIIDTPGALFHIGECVEFQFQGHKEIGTVTFIRKEKDGRRFYTIEMMRNGNKVQTEESTIRAMQ